LFDHRLLKLARESAAEVTGLIPAGAEAVLLIEYESDTPGGAAAAAAELTEQLTRGQHLALHAQTATEPDAMERLWCLREIALPSLYGLRGGAHPLAFVEDVGVPVEELPVFLRRVQEI